MCTNNFNKASGTGRGAGLDLVQVNWQIGESEGVRPIVIINDLIYSSAIEDEQRPRTGLEPFQ